MQPAFIQADDPDHPGWQSWRLSDPTRFNASLGPMIVRRDGALARVRMVPEHRHTNLQNSVHGGVTLAFIDVALFAGARMFGLVEAGAAVTVDLSVQFLGAAMPGAPIEAEVELLRETRRLVFMRGLVTQGLDKVAAFAGTIRKPTTR